MADPSDSPRVFAADPVLRTRDLVHDEMDPLSSGPASQDLQDQIGTGTILRGLADVNPADGSFHVQKDGGGASDLVTNGMARGSRSTAPGLAFLFLCDPQLSDDGAGAVAEEEEGQLDGLALRSPYQMFLLDTTGRRTPAHQLDRVPGSSLGQWFAVTPDGSAYAWTYSVSQSELFRVTGLN